MRDDDRRRLLRQQVLEQLDAAEVEVVGGLVEQQQAGRLREREGERRALRLPARQPGGIGRLVEAEPVQVLDEPRLGAPALAVVVVRRIGGREAGLQREALAQRRRARQLRLLLDQHDGEAVLALDLAVVEAGGAGEHREQRRLAGAVAADEPDALAVVDRQRRAVEQRLEPERELGVLERDEGHRGSCAAAVRRPARGRPSYAPATREASSRRGSRYCLRNSSNGIVSAASISRCRARDSSASRA